MKSARQEKILEIIDKHEVETQEELISHLIAAGVPVTQATVSRDIRELKLTKVLTGRGSYRYIRSNQNKGSVSVRFNTALADSIQTVDFAGNLIVLKTSPGLASAVATGIDAMHMIEILGCVAGDDTIMIVARSEESAADISDKLKGMMKTI
jgi:transcriptional regulator of arginine metabolism